MVSEESDDLDDPARLDHDTVWLVDPLDGTEEFISRNGEFTVNIGLAQAGADAGVWWPLSQDMLFLLRVVRAPGAGGRSAAGKIQVAAYDVSRPRMVASRSHAGAAVDAFRDALAESAVETRDCQHGQCPQGLRGRARQRRRVPASGSYVEWDTCASHCVLNEGGRPAR